MAESRLSRRAANQGRKQLYWSIGGIIIVIFLALNFGPPALALIGSGIDAITGKNNEENVITASDELKPPTLDPLPKAISENKMTITGTSFYSEGQIEIYVNNSSQRSTKLDNQNFEIKDIELKAGLNTIKAKIIQGVKESDFSESYEISYLKDDPKLEISSPSDGAKFEKADREINVSGNTDPDNTVTVNESIAIVDSSGEFSYTLRLVDGENKVKVIAENLAGKKAEKEITISYSP